METEHKELRIQKHDRLEVATKECQAPLGLKRRLGHNQCQA
jgi:hypothetical protein